MSVLSAIVSLLHIEGISAERGLAILGRMFKGDIYKFPAIFRLVDNRLKVMSHVDYGFLAAFFTVEVDIVAKESVELYFDGGAIDELLPPSAGLIIEDFKRILLSDAPQEVVRIIHQTKRSVTA